MEAGGKKDYALMTKSSSVSDFFGNAPSDIAYLLESCRIYREALERIVDDDGISIEAYALACNLRAHKAMQVVDALEGK